MTFTGVIIDGLDPVLERPAWLEWRRTHVGASDVAGILGLSPWSSPWSVWADKCGLLPEEPENEAMEAGRWLESAIGPWFSHRTGLCVVGEQTVIEAEHDPLASCTIDGAVSEWADLGYEKRDLAEHLSGALGGLQIKTAGFGKPWDPIPAHYQAQEQWAMHVTGWERVWFAVLMGRRLDVHELERDDTDIAFMVERVSQFWSEHVVTGIPPATDGSDATLRAIQAVYPHGDPDKTAELDEYEAVLEEWRDAKSAKSVAEKREKEAKAALCAALGDAEEGTVDGEPVLTYREQTRESYVVKESRFRVLRAAPAKKKASNAA